MIVVTGATGNVGRPLVEALAAAGEQVTAVSRRAPDAGLPDGVRHRRVDLTDPDGLRGVLDGAEALFLHDGGVSHLPVHDHLDAAKAAGVRRVVQLSSQGALTRPESESHGKALRSYEEAARGSGMAWTILRPGGFDSNAFAWAGSVRTERTVAAPFGDVGLPTVDPADVAGVAVAALTSDEHLGQTYVLTGPARCTPREQAAAIGDAVGEPVTFVELTRDQALTGMLRFMPEPVAQTTLDILGAPTPVEQQVSPDVERVLGRAPRSFAEWAARNVAAYR
ncbi:NAD(P)H-binding protein [Pseudonocardia sp. MH-G8]|uniref:NAD(P)H-binding protein n=1 Tax=Pseudonocardia sp. MH-G8 TaxID=1854588 RepID=UPI000B9FF3EB|nr:NAD(P)H-binding protein [Pseudonocardia sp. MH-G8]OZM83053.1 NmrA family transcriptional regulator [Pseudonocardia sp. MH-G8]